MGSFAEKNGGSISSRSKKILGAAPAPCADATFLPSQLLEPELEVLQGRCKVQEGRVREREQGTPQCIVMATYTFEYKSVLPLQ